MLTPPLLLSVGRHSRLWGLDGSDTSYYPNHEGREVRVFVRVAEDRHMDPAVEVFANELPAVLDAQRWAKNHAYYPENIKEEKLDGYIYFCRYSSESDCVWVQEKELKGEG